MKVAVLGVGYWGPNLIRNFLGNKDVEKVWAADVSEKRLEMVRKKFPGVETTKDVDGIIKSKEIDLVAISTPISHHYTLAKKVLSEGKRLWVEKPFTSTSAQAQELIEISEKKNLPIFVDHTFLYTGAVRKMKELIVNDSIGDILYFDSVRINLGLFQSDVNVIWDLAPHDLSIMFYILDKKPIAVNANGIANYYTHENVAHISVYFNDNCFAHFHINWTSPVKIRKMIVGGSNKMLVFDDMENSEKIKVYDSGIEIKEKEGIYDALVQYRIGDMSSPKVNQTEALALGVEEFINSIKENRQPLTNAYDGLNVVKILEAADKSIKHKGELMEIK
jgi:predicted dehydrogenase